MILKHQVLSNNFYYTLTSDKHTRTLIYIVFKKFGKIIYECNLFVNYLQVYTKISINNKFH